LPSFVLLRKTTQINDSILWIQYLLRYCCFTAFVLLRKTTNNSNQ